MDDGSCCVVSFYSLHIFHCLSQVQQLSICRSVGAIFESVVASKKAGKKKRTEYRGESDRVLLSNVTDYGIRCLSRNLSELFPPHEFIQIACHLLWRTPPHPFKLHLGTIPVRFHILCMHYSQPDKFNRMVNCSVGTNIGKGPDLL